MTETLCMLATDWDGSLPDGGMMLEEKHNGLRALYFAGRDGGKCMWTRGGMTIEGTEHIRHRLGLLEQIAGCDLFVDGEFIVDGTLAATKAWFERGWRGGGCAGTFHAFDILPLDQWRRGGWDAPLYERKAWLQQLMTAVDDDPKLNWEWRPGSHGRDERQPPVVVAPDVWIFDADGALSEARRVWARVGEGCMLKDAEAPYVRRRCRAWQKLKRL